MSLARVFCSWSIAAVLLLLSIHFSSSEKSLDPVVPSDENGEEGNGTANVTLTGNPQIDYVHDPNLPRELNGYNLSDYPFYSRVPKNINFSCDGRKEGFYASVEHKCQIYHHCLFGSRFDFLCANYTAFDQKTFICQFVSDVDCSNSHMYFHRNNDLYVTKSTTAAPPINIDRDFYARRPPKKHKSRPRLAPVADDYGNDGGADKQTQTQTQDSSTSAPTAVEENSGPAPPARKRPKDTEYADDDDYYEDDWDYPRRPARRRRRKCRNGRRRGRRCRPRRPAYYDDDYDEDDYDYAYYDDARPRKGGKRRRPLNAIPAGTSQVTLTSSSETPAPTSTTTTTTTTTEPPPMTSSELSTTTLSEFDNVAAAEKQRGELLSKTRRPFSNFRNSGVRPSRQNDKNRFGGTTSTSTTTTTTTTTTERAKPSTTKATTTTTEVPQYIYDYEYYEDDTMVDQDASSSTTTTTTTQKPSLRSKLRGGNSAAALLEKQRVQQSIQVRVTDDSETSTNTIRRRDNSNVQTPTRVATPPPSTTSKTTTTVSTSPVSRPARFWQRKSTVKSISTTKAPTTTTTTTLAPYYQEYQDEDYEDAEVAQPTAPAPAPPQPPKQTSRFQSIVNTPQHQYGTSPAAALRQTSYLNAAPSASPHIQQSAPSRGGGQGSSLSSSSYAQPSSQSQLRSNKQQHYAMQQQPQQYSQSSSSSSSISSNGNSNSNRDTSSNYNTNSYHRQRVSPPQPVPKPEFISLVDEDYNNPYVSGPSAPAAQASTSPSSNRFHGGGRGGSGSGALALGNPGYHQQHPIRFFEQHQAPAFLFGAASEYNNPQFAFPPRNYPSPSNFQPYGQSTRRFAPHHMYK